MDKDLKEYLNCIWCKSYQVVVAKPMSQDFINPTCCGSGFVIWYKGYKFFITADHVIHSEHFEADERVAEDNKVGVPLNKNDIDHYTSIIVPLGGFVDFTKFALPQSDNDIQFPELIDITFCEVGERLNECVTTELRINDEIIIPVGESKGLLLVPEDMLQHPSYEDSYAIAGTILKVHKSGIRFSPLNAIYLGLKYRETRDNLFHLQNPEEICYENWAGLSGSPVFNNKRQLLGVLLRVEDKGHAVWVKPIYDVLKLIDYSLQMESIKQQTI